MSWAFYYLVVAIYGSHVLIDFACLACTLLDPFVWSLFETRAASLLQDEDEPKQQPSPPAPPSYGRQRLVALLKYAWEKIIFLYPSLFKDENLDKVRYLLYWNACSSIVKFSFLVYPTAYMLVLISILYIFDFLVYEYEGFTANTLIYQKARIISSFSLGMSILSIILCLWVD